MVYCKLGVLGGWGDPLAEPKWLAGVNKWDQRQSSWQNKYMLALARIRKRQMATMWVLNLKSPDEYISLSEGLLPLIVFHSFHSIWVQALRWCHQPWGGFCSSWMGGLWTATALTPGWPIIVVGYQDCSKRGYSSKAYWISITQRIIFFTNFSPTIKPLTTFAYHFRYSIKLLFWRFPRKYYGRRQCNIS